MTIKEKDLHVDSHKSPYGDARVTVKHIPTGIAITRNGSSFYRIKDSILKDLEIKVNDYNARTDT